MCERVVLVLLIVVVRKMKSLFSKFVVVVHTFDDMLDRPAREPLFEVIYCNFKFLDKGRVTSKVRVFLMGMC